jgi:hypothetical protein
MAKESQTMDFDEVMRRAIRVHPEKSAKPAKKKPAPKRKK